MCNTKPTCDGSHCEWGIVSNVGGNMELRCMLSVCEQMPERNSSLQQMLEMQLALQVVFLQLCMQ